MKIIYIFLILWTSLSFAENNPSFDCAKAKSTVENTICVSPDLSRWDAVLAETFRQKKENSEFKKEYLAWIKERDKCNRSETQAKFCLREKYAIIFGLIFAKYDGPAIPIIPSPECFRPFLPYMNGDQGFYAVRLISAIRGCEDLNLNIIETSPEAQYQVRFINKNQNTYYYSIEESVGNVKDAYKIGVRFEARKVIVHQKEESTLIMMLVETN